ncbi:MAG: hypothetical protein H6696_02815 [Deferribacteres bacterium]|nr:hypothetical protein [candidate division KSB1 bacterium]MCB9500847.1 hypothetical protein [Deferribacteres bacterium]
MTPEKLNSLFDRIKETRIAVIGDFCLDVYWEIDMSTSEISIETGLPTYPVRTQRYSLGGAGNVVANLAALGVKEISAFAVLGHDMFASELLAQLNQFGVNLKGIQFQNVEWDTPVYIKRIRDGKERSRIDFSNFNRLQDAVAEKIIVALQKNLAHFDIVIVNQQLIHGLHSPHFRQLLAALIKTNKEKLFLLDSRDCGNDYDGSIRKINEHEAMSLCGEQAAPDTKISEQKVTEAARELAKRWQEVFFITRGENGLFVVDNDTVTEIPAVIVQGEVDTVGAGDTMLAAIAATLAAGGSFQDAGELGALATAITVKKLHQCGTASPQEIKVLQETQGVV